MKKLFIGIMMIAVVLSSCGTKTQEEDTSGVVTLPSGNTYPKNSPVAKFGALQVKGLQLSDKDGNPAQLAGMSSAGLHWFENCYTRESIETLAKDWNISVFRIANYVGVEDQDGYNKDPEKMRNFISQIVDWCGEFGVYALIDWHVLQPGNPLAPEYAGAEDFFNYFATKYAGKEHVLYEICNEPNNCQRKGNKEQPWVCTEEKNVTWEMIAEYANKIIPVIHAAYDKVNAPKPIVIVGTPQWCQLVDAPLKEGRYQGNGKDLSDPLTDRDATLKYDNIMYTFHFYAAEHNEGFRQDGKTFYYNFYAYMNEVLGKLPVFCTEFGIARADGDGFMDTGRADSWLHMFNGKNKGNQKVSWVNWSYNDKEELISALEEGACSKQAWNDLSISGDYAKRAITVVNTGKEDSQVLTAESLVNLERFLQLNW